MANRIPLVLIPGLLCDDALWQSQINALKDITNPFVARTTNHDSIGALAAAILRKAPPRFALAGLSMGGYVALEIMRQAQERVLKLAIFDSSSRPDVSQQQERRRLLMNMSKAGQFKGVTPRLLPTLIHPAHLEDKAVTDVIMQMAERVGRDAFLNQQTAIMSRTDSRPFLPQIKCPTLIAGGLQDVITPPEVIKEMADAIPNARLEMIDICGHMAPLEQPGAVNSLMRQWIA